MKKLLALLLALCLSLGCLTMAVSAREMAVLELEPDKSITFTVTKDEHTVEYGFTPEESGLYVFYDVDGGFQTSQIQVERVSLERQTDVVAHGTGRVSFEAEAGVNYRFTIDCSFKDAAIEYEFMLSRAVEPESIAFGGSPRDHGFVGEGGSLRLEYAPMNAASEILWTTNDPNVVTVAGDANGASYQLVGPGVAVITATAANGLVAQLHITVLALVELELDGTVEHTIAANGGVYEESEQDFCFTPGESGTYVLSVSYDETLDQYHGLQMSVGSGADSVRGEQVLRFHGEAGVTSYINVEFWGAYEKPVTYSFRLTAAVPAEQLRLEPDQVEGYVGSSVGVQAVWLPENSIPEELTWSVSDPQILQLRDTSTEYATVELLVPGTAAVTATTAGGLTDSFQITVYEAPKTIVLEQDVAASVTLLGGSSVEVSFTPEQTGHYRFTASVPELAAHLYADSVSDAGAVLYHLEAGTTYYGTVDNRADTTVSGELYITRDQVLLPVGMEITKLPGNTTYLKEMLADMWTYQLLAGLEMEISWSDGTKSLWRFDEEGPYVGSEFLSWELKDSDAGTDLLLQCHGVTTSFPLTVLDKSITGIALVDDSPLVVVERSCGMDMGDGEWYYSPYLFGMREVKISFSDGSTVVARPDELVYGVYVTCEDSQSQKPWVKGEKGSVSYTYDDFTVQLEVQVVDSPVTKLELVELPVDTIVIGDQRFFSGDTAYYFAPKDLRDMLAGMVLKITYQDGTTRDVTMEDLQWQIVQGVEYPCVDGYPLGLFGELMMSNELITDPCEREGQIEYKGQSVSYTIKLVEKLPDPPVEPTDPTDPTDPTVTEPVTVPTEPTVTEPTEPSALPTDPTSPSVDRPTEPSQTEDTAGTTQPTQPSGTKPPVDRDGDDTGIVIGVIAALLVVAAAAAILVPKLLKKK